MFIALQEFDFTIRYQKGTEMYIDALSRDYLPETPQGESLETVLVMEQLGDEEMEAVYTAEAVAESGICLQTLRKLTEEDEAVQQSRNMIKCGWPKTKLKVPNAAMPYYSFQDEMAYYDGIVMKGSRCIVPKKNAHGSD